MHADLLRRVFELAESGLVPTQHVAIGSGVLASVPELVRRVRPEGAALVVADDNTFMAAGSALLAAFRLERYPTRCVIVQADCVRDCHAELVRESISELGTCVPVAVGSGTVNDIVKLAAASAGTPYVAVATAASMNGYASPISAVLRDGLKTTAPAEPPYAIVYDTETVANAPREMTASGYADVLAKPTSVADWLIARDLAGDPFSEGPLAVMDGVVEAVVSEAGAIAACEPSAIELLCAGLTLSGFQMAMAGSSQPASGSEHLISHYFDTIGHSQGWPLDLHGRQVGVGCIMMSALFERLLTLEAQDLAAAPEDLDAQSLRDRITRAYGCIAPAVLSEFAAKSPDRATVEARLARARAAWPELREALREVTVPAATMRQMLGRGGAPTTLREIGRTRGEAQEALIWARVMRRRYTALDLAAEIGALAEWGKAALDAVA